MVIQKQIVESEIQFQDREMLKILQHAFYAVAVALRKQEMQGALECFYWQSAQQEEVDFVIKKGTENAQLIQVCFSLEDLKTESRETRALLKASEELRCKDLLILTDSTEGEEVISWYGTERTVRYAPLQKWLLHEAS